MPFIQQNHDKDEAIVILKRFIIARFGSKKKFLTALFFGILFIVLAVPVVLWNKAIKERRQAEEMIAVQEKERSDRVIAQQAERRKGEATSIATFFIAGPQFASLRIYSSWEGNYRVRDSGESTSFEYIGEGTDNSKKILEIRYMAESGWKEQAKDLGADGWAEILRKNGYVFAYKIWPSDPGKPLTDKYNIMLIDAAELIKSFRVFKNG